MSRNNKPLDFSLVLASSVHDMKNSLGMLLNSLEDVIHSTPLQDEAQRKRFGTLQYEASRINTELVQVLTIYRMQNNGLPIHIDQYHVIDVLEEQLARNHMLFETRCVRIEVDCEAELNWYFDNDLIGSVVHNILVNCARYTKKALRLSAAVENETLCIEIADDGEGYPQAMLESEGISEDNESLPEGATHLGLFFAREIAAMHCQKDRCGRIQLENNGPLGGGVFKLYLP